MVVLASTNSRSLSSVIALVLACALASALPSKTTAQQNRCYPGIDCPEDLPGHRPLPHPSLDTLDLRNHFVVDASWETPTHLKLRLRAKEKINGTIKEYVQSGSSEWFDMSPVDVPTRYGCGWGERGCRQWLPDEAVQIERDFPSNTSTVRLTFDRQGG